MAARDQSDRTRSTSPLTIPNDAVQLDTTGLSIDETVEHVLSIVSRATTVQP
jgi:cytidylate kinase